MAGSGYDRLVLSVDGVGCRCKAVISTLIPSDGGPQREEVWTYIDFTIRRIATIHVGLKQVEGRSIGKSGVEKIK